MLVLTALQSIAFLVITLAVVFFGARVIADAERRQLTSAAETRQVSLAHLMAEPEPATAPSAHLRLVWSQPAVPADEPYDQMKELAL